MGVPTAPELAMVQIPDGGARVKMTVIREEFERGGELHDLLLNYTRAFIKQVTQTAACNAIHTAEERLARWLLMCHDRVQSDELALTHEFLAEMLGTRRATVSTAASALQVEGLIQYRRGHISIVDRPALEIFVCECYAAGKDGSTH
jgi:CRP-like cAMP-binding protein